MHEVLYCLFSSILAFLSFFVFVYFFLFFTFGYCFVCFSFVCWVSFFFSFSSSSFVCAIFISFLVYPLLFVFVFFLGFQFPLPPPLFLFFLFFSRFEGCFCLGANWVFSCLFCFSNHSFKQNNDTCRHRRVLPDDVVMAEIGDQALDIYLHGPVSTHKNGIGKTFTHTSIPFQPATLLKQRAKPSTHET